MNGSYKTGKDEHPHDEERRRRRKESGELEKQLGTLEGKGTLEGEENRRIAVRGREAREAIK
ncbi:hypothetical protein Dda_6060 [Drechslerella dactyloides]|uniref:Uncharacterized protein n=1 Tax=Drechslerella dactyloides TaxID=74499 RepID=A0AAD6NI86_DREDA|nr:hypothetical protein Dda_6060 [Drechslerella dactyloides]